MDSADFGSMVCPSASSGRAVIEVRLVIIATSSTVAQVTHEMVIRLRAQKAVCCDYARDDVGDDVGVSFPVRGLPEYGALELAAFENRPRPR